MLETNRLILRSWKPEDYEPFFQLNSDPEVMEFFPKPLSREESDQLANKASGLIKKNGWGFWACELKESSEFIGFVGLNRPDYDLPFGSCVEIGWRVAKKFWKKGYATEAAVAAMIYAFDVLELDEVVSFAVKNNDKSTSVMKRLGMIDTQNNFEHPKVPEGSSLREHVLYKINRVQWNNKND